MMYIEQAPLGGNLEDIIKKSASLSNNAATPTSASSASHTKELSSHHNNESGRKKAAINGGNSIPNGNHQEDFSNQNLFDIKNHLTKIYKEKNNDKEEDLEEHYELFEIDRDSEEDIPKEINIVGDRRNNLVNGYKIEFSDEPVAKEETTATTTKRSRSTYEADDNYTEYIVSIQPVHKSNSQARSSKKTCRPIPAAIPFVLNGFISRPASVTYERSNQEEYNSNVYSYIESDLADGDFVPHDSQMGIDILGSIRNLFKWKAKNDNTNPEVYAAGAKRKRGFGNYQPEFITGPHQIKYRKVENNFPKYITHTLDDDDVDNFPTYRQLPTSSNRQRLEDQDPERFYSIPQSFEMEQRGENCPTSQRRSLFALPQTKIVRNNLYADYEYSDDEDDNAETARLQRTLGLNIPKVRNIPIQVEQSHSPTFVPPYANTYRPPTYADILKQTTSFGRVGAGNILGNNSSNNSSGDRASTSRFCSGIDNTSRVNSRTLGGSILKQEREKADHEKYKQLLERLVPFQQSMVYPNSRPLSRNTIRSLTSTSNLKKKSSFAGKLRLPTSKRQTPLSSTINIDDGDDDSNDSSSDEVTVTGITHLNSKPPIKGTKKSSAPISTVIVDNDDDEISEIIDLSGDEETTIGKEAKRKNANTNEIIDLEAKENKFDDLPHVEPVNSFRELLYMRPNFKVDWFQNFNCKWEKKGKLRNAEVAKTLEVTEKLEAERRVAEHDLQTRLRDFRIVDPELLAVDDFEKPEEVPEFPPLTDERQARIKAAIYGPADQVLIEKFNLRITRRDIHTLLGLSWLNDEVINFYMSMITERSEKKHETHGIPKAYAMNTFFLQRLLQSGHGGVKRWTRKVNIFEKDIIPVPVHVGGVHWCMAIIHLKNRWIRYYDSMGAPNPTALKALEQYLIDESLDKRNQTFDTSDFVIESIRDVPRQQNGSDCGVFSCMFAEYITRNKEITFSQQNMDYFRHKMIFEIVQGELLH